MGCPSPLATLCTAAVAAACCALAGASTQAVGGAAAAGRDEFVTVLGKSERVEAPEAARDNAPVPVQWSWDTIPYFVHCQNSTGVLNANMVTLMSKATFTVIQTEQCLDCPPNRTGGEEKMAAAAAQIRAVNPKAPVIFYFPVDQARNHTDLGRWFYENPQYLLHNQDGTVWGNPGIPDWSQTEAVQAWANGIAAAVKKGQFDGVFIDGYRSEWASMEWNYKTPLLNKFWNHTKATEWIRGIWNATGPALRAALPQSAVMIPNCEAKETCEDGHGHSQIPGYTSVMMEYFEVSEPYINNVQQVAEVNTLAEVNAYIKVYDGNTFALPNLVAFLVGAGNRTAFSAIGWYWECDTVVGLPEYRNALGRPTGPAALQTVGNTSLGWQVWRRTFGNGTKIMLNVSYPWDTIYHSTKCCIWWSSGQVSTCPNSKC